MFNNSVDMLRNSPKLGLSPETRLQCKYSDGNEAAMFGLTHEVGLKK